MGKINCCAAITTAKTVVLMKPAPMARRKTWYFATKPAVSGMPARESSNSIVTIASHGAKFGVAPLGTSLTEEQAVQLAHIAARSGTSPVVATENPLVADPREQEIAATLLFKPSILQRKTILQRIQGKIKDFIDTFIEGMGGIA